MLDEQEGGEQDVVVPQVKAVHTANNLLADLSLAAALTPAQAGSLRSTSGRLAALVVVAPSAEWVKPLEAAACRLSSWDLVVAPADARWNKKEDLAPMVAAALARGGRVLGVSQDPARTLPSCLVSAADLTVRVEPPRNATVAKLIGLVSGGRPRGLPAGVALGLDYRDIAAAVRRGSTAAQCRRRLVAARESKSVVDATLARSPTLDRLHGYGDAMAWCTDLVADLDRWRRGDGPFPPNSRAVLSGPPGTGKTQLVRSLAVTAGLPLITSSVGSWFAESSGALDGVVKRIAQLWDTARALRPCIVFLDELDGLPNRATMDNRGRDWWTPVVDFMLTSLDSAVSGVTNDLVIVGATNHAEHLDAALIRPGRLERVIYVGYPASAAEREGVFRTHLDGALDGVDIAAAAQASSGLSGADIMAVVRNARKRARLAGRAVEFDDLMVELVPADTRSEADRRRVAAHEAGHALAACALGVALDAVSIVDRPDRGGDTSYSLAGASQFPTRSLIERSVVLALAGGVAEEALTGSRSSGQGGSERSDIGQATSLVTALHASFGLGDTLVFRSNPDGAPRLLETDPELRRKVEGDLTRLHASARGLLAERMPALEWLAGELLRSRFLTGDEVRAGLLQFGVPDPPGGPAEDDVATDGPACPDPSRSPPSTLIGRATQALRKPAPEAMPGPVLNRSRTAVGRVATAFRPPASPGRRPAARRASGRRGRPRDCMGPPGTGGDDPGGHAGQAANHSEPARASDPQHRRQQ